MRAFRGPHLCPHRFVAGNCAREASPSPGYKARLHYGRILDGRIVDAILAVREYRESRDDRGRRTVACRCRIARAKRFRTALYSGVSVNPPAVSVDTESRMVLPSGSSTIANRSSGVTAYGAQCET
jgi:hypothetical protein